MLSFCGVVLAATGSRLDRRSCSAVQCSGGFSSEEAFHELRKGHFGDTIR